MKGELDKLRRQQAARVMPIVGAILDCWDGTENDEHAYPVNAHNL